MSVGAESALLPPPHLDHSLEVLEATLRETKCSPSGGLQATTLWLSTAGSCASPRANFRTKENPWGSLLSGTKSVTLNLLPLSIELYRALQVF